MGIHDFSAKLGRRSRGQALVLVALMLVGLLAAAGLAIDGGQTYEFRRQMQNAADAGAYRGARELAFYRKDASNGYAGIYSKIQNYVTGDPTGSIGNQASSFTANYMPSGTTIQAGVPPAAADNCVKVTANRNYQPYILGLLGFNNLSVGATATACIGWLRSPGTGIRPFAVLSQTFDYDTEYCLFDSAGSTGCIASPGNFGWLDLDGGENSSSNASTPAWLAGGFSGNYMYWTQNDCGGADTVSQRIIVPSCLALDTGVANNTNMRQAMDGLLAGGTEIVIPLYDRIYGTGAGSRIHIVAFVKFVISSYSLSGNPKYIRGQFKEYVDPGEICSGAGCAGGLIVGSGVQLVN